MAFLNINKELKEEYSMNKTFSAEYYFSCVRQIACADRFACVCDRTRQMKRPAHTVNMYLNAILPHVRMACQISVQDHIHMA